METSQQQRRSTVGQFAKTLTDADLEFDAIDLVDMLWLAQFMESGESVVPPEPKEEAPERQPDAVTNNLAVDEPGLGLYSESPPATSTTTETNAEPKETPKGMPFSVPAAPAIRTRMELARALRPLMRKVSSRTRFDLDEDATVTQIAETEVWMPVVCPTPERWLELDLVVESAKTTVIWERAIAELNHLAEYQGAFRTVRTWRLSVVDSQIQLFPRWRDFSTQSVTASTQTTSARPHTPRELIDPSGRRLIWLVTDCTSSLWRRGVIHAALQQWAAIQPVVIVQMFPESLWKRTALRDGHQVKLSALAPGLPSNRLQVEGLPLRLERQSHPDLVTVPVITLDSASIRRWARVVAGSGDTRTPGRTFDLAFIARQISKVGSRAPSRPVTQRTAQERVDFFRATTASETVKHLANLMAATPVSLPVIDLLRDAFRADFKEEVRQSDVAEVLLSGLLRRCDTEDDKVCRYEFWGDDSSNPNERVRDILLGDASVSKTIEVLNVLSASLCRKIGSPVKSFQALLAEFYASEQNELRDAALPFARVGADVLLRLGGEYAETIRRYELARHEDIASQEEADDWLAEFPLENFEYEVAEHLNFPPLESFNFVDIQFDNTWTQFPILQPFEFTDVQFDNVLPSNFTQPRRLSYTEFPQEEEWLAYLFQEATPDERILYRHWYSLRNIEPSENLLSRYNQLFIEGAGYRETEIRQALVRLVRADFNGRSLLPVINCCCYILANYWRIYPSEHFAITELVELFDNLPSRKFIALEGKRLQEIIKEYSNSQEMKELRQFADLYRPVDQILTTTSIRETLAHFPFLYETPEMLPPTCHKFHVTGIRDLRLRKERAQKNILLPYYLAWKEDRVMPSLENSGIVLTERELNEAFQTFTGKVGPHGSHAQAARSFKKTLARNGCSYMDFIERFCDFLLAPVGQLVQLGLIKADYFKKIQSKIHRFLKQFSSQWISISSKTIQNICRQLMQFLTMEEGLGRYHYNFLDMQSILGNAATVDLLLRLALFCKKAKSDMERGFAKIFKHYQDHAIAGEEVDWLIPIFEYTNIAFLTNFGEEIRKFSSSLSSD